MQTFFDDYSKLKRKTLTSFQVLELKRGLNY